jgi:hypothetical protein
VGSQKKLQAAVDANGLDAIQPSVEYRFERGGSQTPRETSQIAPRSDLVTGVGGNAVKTANEREGARHRISTSRTNLCDQNPGSIE